MANVLCDNGPITVDTNVTSFDLQCKKKETPIPCMPSIRFHEAT